MTLRAEIEALKNHLDELGRPCAEDESFTLRYALRRPPLPRGLYWQLRWVAGRVVRGLEDMGVLRPDPWPASLQQAPTSIRARPLLIWAVGADRDTLRTACSGIGLLQGSLPHFAPILITDVTDFAFFSRLGWLVEYLPTLSGGGGSYGHAKARMVARLYSGAPALPINAGLHVESCSEELRRWVLSGN